ncbi:response regulator [Teredinibacter turnerae]|uniref:response regulator transcription factor n=1 Tax=Teredinibacter turnerae TaxID=2426 RepID=UPI0005F7AC47|nr:response regulator transcription factor [Teredinibacter turnerae]
MNPPHCNDKILIAEDHDLYRDGLHLLLAELLPGATVNTADDFPSAFAKLKSTRDYNLVTLDVKMPGTRDLDGLKAIRNEFPTLTIIVISTIDFGTSTRQMLDAGANGFIAKSTSKEEMKNAIQEILNGNIVVKSAQEDPGYIDLTTQQRATLRYLAEGLSNKEIAIQLGVSPSTAKEYVSKVIERLNATNRTQAVLAAQREGLLIDHLVSGD